MTIVPLGSIQLPTTNFTTLDWVIVLLYPLISVGIGLYVRKLVKDMSDFVAAGQGLGVWLGIATMTGTELGLITVMYNAQKGFTGALAALHIGLAAGIVTLLVGLSGFIVFRLRALNVLTIPEFYQKRFDRKTRVLGGIMMALGGILNMGLFLQVGSKFVVGITGLADSSFALPLAMSILIALVLVYTCLGGMISVVISDYVQFVVLSIGLLVATYFAIDFLGWNNIFETVRQEVGIAGFDPTVESGTVPSRKETQRTDSSSVPESDTVVPTPSDLDRAGTDETASADVDETEVLAKKKLPAMRGGFGWDYIIWMAFLGLVSCGIWPTSVARALAMDSPQAVKQQYTLASISFLIRFLIPCFWGVCALVYVLQHDALRGLFFPAGYPAPDPMPAGLVPKENLYAMPLFLGQILPVGVIGIITAGMIAAFMSTHDSYLLCWSSVLTQDVVAPICAARGREISGKQRIALTRFFIVVIGIYVLIWGLFYHGSDDIWDYMAVTGAIYYNGAFALLLGGLYWKRASRTGAFLALLAGTLAVVGLSPVQHGIGMSLNALAGNSPERLAWLDQWFPWTDVRDIATSSGAAQQIIFKISAARVGLLSIAGTTSAMFFGSLLFPDRPDSGSENQSPINERAKA